MQLTLPPAAYEGHAKSSDKDYLVIPGVTGVGSGGTFAPGANVLWYFPIYLSAALTISGLLTEVTTAGAASTLIRLGIYNTDANWQPTSLIVDAGTVAADSTGVKEAAITQTLGPGRYLLAWWTNSGAAIRYTRAGSRYTQYNPSLGANHYGGGMAISSTFGAFPATGTAWTSASQGFGSAPPPYLVWCRITP